MAREQTSWNKYESVDWTAWKIEWIIHDQVITGPIRKFEDFRVSLFLVVWLLDLQSLRIPLKDTHLEKDAENGRLYFSLREGGLENHYCLIPPKPTNPD